jgi:hypothetical protein
MGSDTPQHAVSRIFLDHSQPQEQIPTVWLQIRFPAAAPRGSVFHMQVVGDDLTVLKSSLKNTRLLDLDELQRQCATWKPALSSLADMWLQEREAK